MAVLSCSKIFFSAALVLMVESQSIRSTTNYLSNILDSLKNIEYLLGSESSYISAIPQDLNSEASNNPKYKYQQISEELQKRNINVNKNVNNNAEGIRRSISSNNADEKIEIDVQLPPRREVEVNKKKNHKSKDESSESENEDVHKVNTKAHRKNKNLNSSKNTNGLSNEENKDTRRTLKRKSIISTEEDMMGNEMIPKSRRSANEPREASSEEAT